MKNPQKQNDDTIYVIMSLMVAVLIIIFANYYGCVPKPDPIDNHAGPTRQDGPRFEDLQKETTGGPYHSLPDDDQINVREAYKSSKKYEAGQVLDEAEARRILQQKQIYTLIGLLNGQVEELEKEIEELKQQIAVYKYTISRYKQG